MAGNRTAELRASAARQPSGFSVSARYAARKRWFDDVMARNRDNLNRSRVDLPRKPASGPNRAQEESTSLPEAVSLQNKETAGDYQRATKQDKEQVAKANAMRRERMINRINQRGAAQRSGMENARRAYGF